MGDAIAMITSTGFPLAISRAGPNHYFPISSVKSLPGIYRTKEKSQRKMNGKKKKNNDENLPKKPTNTTNMMPYRVHSSAKVELEDRLLGAHAIHVGDQSSVNRERTSRSIKLRS